jgi:hypothetical protein
MIRGKYIKLATQYEYNEMAVWKVFNVSKYCYII